MKFDEFPDDSGNSAMPAAAAASTGSGSVPPQLQQSLQQQLHQQMSMQMMAAMNSGGGIPSAAYDAAGGGFALSRPSSAQSSGSNSSAAETSGDEPRANLGRSLSEDLVSILSDNPELFGKQQQAGVKNPRRQLSPPNGMLFGNSGGGLDTLQQQQQQQHLQLQQQLLFQQQLQQQQQLHQQMAMASENARWLANAQNAAAMLQQQQQRPEQFARRNSGFEAAGAAGAATLGALPDARTEQHAEPPQQLQTSVSTPTVTPAGATTPVKAAAAFGSFLQPGDAAAADPKANIQSPNGSTTASDTSSDAGGASSASSSTSVAGAINSTSTSTSSANATVSAAASAANPFSAQNSMMMPGFMMYPMPMMGNYQANPMSMMQMPMGMGMGLGMQLPMGMQMPMGMGMQVPMGMQLPMGMPLNGMGLPLGMQLPLGMHVSPPNGVVDGSSSGSGPSDMEVTPIAAGAAAAAAVPTAGGGAMLAPPTLKPARALQPKDPRGPGFVNIARKPDEPEVSSILKALMDEEAKKKEKKLERNRDSARESRKKQQSYVEALETGIKRLQINRDLVAAYRWGVTGPGFGPLPCPQSPQMFDWKTRVWIVTGESEAFSNIQNPAGFHSLMRMNRQRRVLSMSHWERERALAKSFATVGRRLAALRARVLEAQALRSFSDHHPLAAELSAALNLSADQKLQLQCHAQRVLDDDVLALVKLFKIFFALRAAAARLNVLSPSLERYFRETCSLEQLQKLLQWTETHRAVVETALPFDQ